MLLIAVIGSVTALIFRNERREFSVIVGAVTAVLLLLSETGSGRDILC